MLFTASSRICGIRLTVYSYIVAVQNSWIFLISNWGEIVGLAGAIHFLALAVVNITPTPKDNEAYARFYKVN